MLENGLAAMIDDKMRMRMVSELAQLTTSCQIKDHDAFMQLLNMHLVTYHSVDGTLNNKRDILIASPTRQGSIKIAEWKDSLI